MWELEDPVISRQRTMQDRIMDSILFLCAQGGAPTRLDWYQAIDDGFPEFDERGKQRLVDEAIAMLERVRSPAIRREMRRAA